MVMHPALRDRMLETESAVLAERLGGSGVAVRRLGAELRITAPELGDGRVLLIDATRYDSEPVGVAIVDASGTRLPGWRWPQGLYGGEHPVLRRPFTCVRGTEDYHSHPLHRDDPWDNHRARLRLAEVVTHLLRRCRQ